jgi:hypothetical protein
MPQRRRLVRIALELEESDHDEMQSILEQFNAAFAPMKLSRSDLLRSALQDKLAQLRRQLDKLKG